jgi:demethylmenaquinone methyltransferase/2-methoxy-6-polyprenyl-1,4-benzoquinol methylase
MKQIEKSDVWKMFNQISPTYDRANRILSLGIDQYWRKKVARFLPHKEKIRLLDCATGTGDQIFSLMKKSRRVHQAVGVDLASEMLRIGKRKLKDKPYAHRVTLQQASVLSLPFIDDSFDCATISFGIRNVPDPAVCLKEIYRVLSPGGRILVLEFSLPKNRKLKAAHLYYLRHCLPKIGAFISKDKHAYTYLNETIETFPSGGTFCNLLTDAGFKNVKEHPLTFGIVTLYQGDK